ncbi:TPA: hypothetical protein SL402_002436 [Pseudomonas aeruginosa]|uniref:hypothetical protein n=1 Tax=Pseudomonas aeruginosa TaxID=287 RepID=UPI000FC41C33|nr:hypothetical protein [Pseudomonas aeruginosa]MCO3843626.1 hypothetical protein [Pseudomonas aeruginosa]NPW39422.1 hypothetical protein [Pseudomonas aeruginosa]RUE28692.1 hypothetical protein IPC1222_00465 [Pseudomonas aeruginosa]HBO0987388.1 hypothetical protein [Pseudomonas aeruginosa]HBP1183182.1 hypothetical protein [Pseudomonas aeruginosa]
MDESDRSLRAMAAAAKGIMSAAESDRIAAEQAVARLSGLGGKVEHALEQIPKVMERTAPSTAERVAELAAAHLTQKFKEANEAAEQARVSFQAASDSLKRRFWLSIFAVNLAAVVPLVLLFLYAIPSTDEIASRRQEVARLEKNIIELKRRGADLTIVDCDGRLCVRTHEKPGEKPYHDQATKRETYRILWTP